jgi:3-phenylpropionate/cinnamic acid dioxygenase small subunit
MSASTEASGVALTADDRHAIQQLLSSYGFHHDARDFASLAECFTEDASYTMVVAGADPIGPRLGRDAIVDQIRIFKSRQTDQRRHVITNFMFDQEAISKARVRSYVTVIAVADGVLDVVSCGFYTDVVVLTELGWRIADKKLHLDKGF